MYIVLVHRLPSVLSVDWTQPWSNPRAQKWSRRDVTTKGQLGFCHSSIAKRNHPEFKIQVMPNILSSKELLMHFVPHCCENQKKRKKKLNYLIKRTDSRRCPVFPECHVDGCGFRVNSGGICSIPKWQEEYWTLWPHVCNTAWSFLIQERRIASFQWCQGGINATWPFRSWTYISGTQYMVSVVQETVTSLLERTVFNCELN